MSPRTCPLCSSSLIEIDMTIDGASVCMRSCNTCDMRWWDARGAEIDLDAVLDMAAATRRPAPPE